MLRRVLSAVAALLVFAAPAAAEPVVFSFSGHLNGGSSAASIPVYPVGQFAEGTAVSGRLIYNGGAPLVRRDITPDWKMKVAEGVAALVDGEVTIGAGASATTIRYEGLNPEAAPALVEQWTRYGAQVVLETLMYPQGVVGSEVVEFALGGRHRI